MYLLFFYFISKSKCVFDFKVLCIKIILKLFEFKNEGVEKLILFREVNFKFSYVMIKMEDIRSLR